MTKTIQVPAFFEPRAYQVPVLRAVDMGYKKIILLWHRRAGKDKTCWAQVVRSCVERPGNYFYIFPTKEEARRALWQNVDKEGHTLMDMIPDEIVESKNSQTMVIKFKNKSTIDVVGLDHNPDAIRGVAAAGAVFSEFAYGNPQAYYNLMPSLKEAGGWVIFNSTPAGRNHYYKLWNAANQSEEWFCSELQCLWPERPNFNPFCDFDPDEIWAEAELAGVDRDETEREYGVAFAAGIKGAYYAELCERAHKEGRVGMYPYDSALPVDTFWDLGHGDDTCIWFRQTSGNAIIFIDFMEIRGVGIHEIVSQLAEKGYNYRHHVIPHDGGHRSLMTNGLSGADILAEALRAYDLPDHVLVNPRTTNKQVGIQKVRERFSRYYFNANKCSVGFEKIALYHKKWDKHRQVFLMEPAHDENSHAADALRTEAESEITSDPYRKVTSVKSNGEFNPLDY